MVVNFTKDTEHHNSTINEAMIEQVREFRYLGTTFDNKLTWKQHIKEVTNKCNKRQYMFRQYKSFGANSTQLDYLFNTMILLECNDVQCYCFIYLLQSRGQV